MSAENQPARHPESSPARPDMQPHDLMSYARVWLTFARNSLVRSLLFRVNFLIEAAGSLTWMLMNLGFYLLVYEYTRRIAGWDRYEFFGFMATTMIVNSLVAAFFMPNAAELSDLVQNGGLDFALLKPIDTQFLVSCARVDWAALANLLFGMLLLAYAVWGKGAEVPWIGLLLYPIFVICGVLLLYCVMISLAATSIWLGRNQSLYDFWFYVTIFSRYPMEIYQGTWGGALQWTFTYLLPILIVVNVPARLAMKPFTAEGAYLTIYAFLATVVSLIVSRWIFRQALEKYRSASS